MADDRAAGDPRQLHAQRAALVHERWGSTDEERLARLARSFPSLAAAAGVAPWDVGALVRWALAPDRTAPARFAVRFLLRIVDPDRDWRAWAAHEGLCTAEDAARADHPLAPFDFAAAFEAWDDAHRGAVIAWSETPFHP
jgi:hypothetical protein